MKVLVGSALVEVSDADQVGTGGQAVVSKSGGYALKIFHDPAEASSVCQILRNHIKEGSYAQLGHISTIPQMIVRDESDSKDLGYAMELLSGFQSVSDLADREFRGENKLGLRAIIHVFAELHLALRSIHANGFRVGDLNVGNFLFKYSEDGVALRAIDVDSWAYAGVEGSSIPSSLLPVSNQDIEHPKLVLDGLTGPEYFLRLEERDWYAYALHLTYALTGIEPFRQGAHQNPSVIIGSDERKKRGMHLWHNQIKLPPEARIASVRLGAKLRFLLKNWMDVNARGEFPLHYLIGDFITGLRRCKCGLESHKSCGRCPKCFTPL